MSEARRENKRMDITPDAPNFAWAVATGGPWPQTDHHTTPVYTAKGWTNTGITLLSQESWAQKTPLERVFYYGSLKPMWERDTPADQLPNGYTWNDLILSTFHEVEIAQAVANCKSRQEVQAALKSFGFGGSQVQAELA
jgi:hypothetical protein